tara:strand:- start:745 stop:945 length:201 start_codon:yes stop_codon:yes gene_type:complete
MSREVKSLLITLGLLLPFIGVFVYWGLYAALLLALFGFAVWYIRADGQRVDGLGGIEIAPDSEGEE